MCSIFTISSNPSLVGKYFTAQIRGEASRSGNNVRITDESMVITADEPNIIQYMHFGLVPSYAEAFKMERATFNATKENLMLSRLWSPLFQAHRRCLVLADGFTEPQKVKGDTQHWRFTVPGQELITFAGLWDEWYDRRTGDRFRSFAVITVPSNVQVGEVHEKGRMPAMIDVPQRDAWFNKELSPEQHLDLLQTWPDERMIREAYDPFNKGKKLPPPDDLQLLF